MLIGGTFCAILEENLLFVFITSIATRVYYKHLLYLASSYEENRHSRRRNLFQLNFKTHLSLKLPRKNITIIVL